MASSINASTTAGLVNTADTSGVLQLQTAGTTAISIDASQAVSFTNSPTVTGGTANGVAYLNGSKVLTTGSALVFDGTNLGVGTTPSTPLHVQAATTGGFAIRIKGRSSDGYGDISFYNNANTVNYAFYGANNAAAYLGSAAAIPLAFYTNNAEVGRFDSSGNLLVGITSGSWHNLIKSSSGGYALNVFNTNASSGDGGMQLRAGTNNTASIVLNAGYQGPSATDTFRIYGNGTYGTISDLTRKKNIESARNGYLQDLQQLRVVKYNWLTQEDGEAKELGFIAQEVEQVFAGLIETDSEGLKMIKQPVLIPMLIKAIQEQQALITQLTARITALESA